MGGLQREATFSAAQTALPCCWVLGRKWSKCRIYDTAVSKEVLSRVLGAVLLKGLLSPAESRGSIRAIVGA